MERKSLNLLELESKAKSKAEIYQLITCEGELFLPPYKYCSIDFIADVVEGKKKVLSNGDVIVRPLPYVKGLRTYDLIPFCIEDLDGIDYLLSDYKKKTPNREWLINLCKDFWLIFR
jgi:hypothetical protein